MTDHPPAHESPEDLAGTERVRAERLARAERNSFFELLPRKDLARIVLLLVVLAVIVAIQRQSGSIVKRLTDGLLGPPPATQKEAAPRVRMAPPAKAP